jgi:NAD(P)-dependent dehydrogenase (short-subunit alcohol dehydrogenase family)
MSASPFSLSGKTVLVTGASSGIGYASATLCAAMGARVIACGRNEERLAGLLAAMAEVSALEHQVIAGDLTDSAHRQALVAGVPPLDGVVFSAGVAVMAPVRMVSENHLDAMLDVNFKAPVLLTQSLLSKKKVAQGASLVYVTSAAAHFAPYATAMYSGAKAALIAVVRTIAIEHAKAGIRANSVNPGYINTPMLSGLQKTMSMEDSISHAALGVIEPEEVAAGIVYLLSPASRWVTRSGLLIDGGLSLHIR